MTFVVLVNPTDSMLNFVDSFNKRGEGAHVVFDSAYKSRYGNCFAKNANTTLDIISNDSLTSALNLIHKGRTDVLVIACHDNVMSATAAACRRLGIIFSSQGSIGLCRNKFKLRQLFCGDSSISFGNISDTPSACDVPLAYPVICKPKCGWGSNWSEKVSNEGQFVKYIELVNSLASPSDYSSWFYGEILDGGYFWEQWIDGPVITAELFVDNDRMLVPMLSIAHQFPNTCLGAGTIIPFLPEQRLLLAIEECIENLVELTRISHGVFDIELKPTNSGVHLLDVNPRPMGGEMIRAFDSVSNISFADLYFDFFCEKKNSRIVYSGYSATQKVMCLDVLDDTRVLDYLEETNAIVYVTRNSFPLPKESILARYIVRAEDIYSCVNLCHRQISEIKPKARILEPNFDSFRQEIHLCSHTERHQVNSRFVSFSMS